MTERRPGGPFPVVWVIAMVGVGIYWLFDGRLLFGAGWLAITLWGVLIWRAERKPGKTPWWAR